MKFWNDRVFPIVISLLLAWALIGEYRDNGWQGLLWLLGLTTALYVAVFLIGVPLTYRWLTRKTRQ
jgi:hypothetical protein